MSVCSTLPQHRGPRTGDLARESREQPRRRAEVSEVSAERALPERLDASARDGPGADAAPGASGQHTNRAHHIADHIDAVYSLIYAGVGNRAEAEELTSRVFDQATPCLGRCTPDETLSLLVRMAHAVVENHWQALSHESAMVLDRRDRNTACQATNANTNATPTVDTALPTPAQRVERILRLLPARERAVLTYRFLLNRSVREIADTLLLTEDAVKALVYRALELAADLERTMT